jgi:hypothetical protein
MRYFLATKSLLKLAFIVSAAATMVGAASATPIVYTFTGIASGSLYSTPVSATSLVQPINSAIVKVTAVSDTNSVQQMPSAPSDVVYQAFNQSLTIEVAGFGNFNVLTPSSTTEFVGVGPLRDILIRTPNGVVVGASLLPATYNLRTDLPPASAAFFSNLTIIATDRGNLHLQFASAGKFSATTISIPLPGTLGLVLFSMFCYLFSFGTLGKRKLIGIKN